MEPGLEPGLEDCIEVEKNNLLLDDEEEDSDEKDDNGGHADADSTHDSMPESGNLMDKEEDTSAAVMPVETETSQPNTSLMEEVDVLNDQSTIPKLLPTPKSDYIPAAHHSCTDLRVTVMEPQQMNDGGWGIGAYTAYSVRTETTRDSYGAESTVVLRRYSDFLWLKEQLAYEFESRLIPPMPPKSEIHKKDPKFLEARRYGLQRFINRLVDHPVLTTSQCLRCFLLTKAHEFQNAKKEFERSFFSRVNESVSRVASSILSKKKDPQMQQLEDQIDNYEGIISQIVKCSAGAEERYSELTFCLKDLGTRIGVYAEKENELREPLRRLQEILDHESEKYANVHQEFGPKVVEPLRDYKRYVDSFKSLLTKFKSLQVDAQVLEDMLESEKKKLSDISKPGGETSESRAKKKESSEAQISNLMTAVEQADDSIEITKSDILADLDRFNANQINDWRVAFGAYADTKIDFYGSTMEKWEQFIQDLGES